MDKYLTRPRNPRASAKQNSSDSTIQVCLADCDNHENYDSQKDYIQCAVGKDIRSFFAKPTIAKDNAKSESPKSVRTSALDFKQLFKKSEVSEANLVGKIFMLLLVFDCIACARAIIYHHDSFERII